MTGKKLLTSPAILIPSISFGVLLMCVAPCDVSAQENKSSGYAVRSSIDGPKSFLSNNLQSISEESILFSADHLTYNVETGDITAIGQVRLLHQGYILLAGRVVYNEKTGKGFAEAAVELTTPTGQKIVSPRMQLNKGLREAFVDNFRLLLADGSQVAATSGTHKDLEGKTVLNNAVYTACEICENSEDPPAWQLKAVKVTHDRNTRRLYYRNASLEIFGVPVLWTPYLSFPDPTVDRASGFLPAEISTRRELGVRIGLPYHHVISDSQDLTLTPILTTRENAVLAAEYRHHHGWLNYTLGGSLTLSDQQADGVNALPSSDEEFRGHIAAKGVANLAEGWRTKFDLNFASDDTYLRRYDFSRTDVLVSEITVEKFYDNAYLSARTLGFQGLRIEDDPGLTGFALPLLTAEYIPRIKPFGGTIELNASTLALQRFEGLDTFRASSSASWRRRLVTGPGLLLDLDGLVRGDIYHVSDQTQPDDPAFGGSGGTTARGITRLTGTLSWPLVKSTLKGTHTLEPYLQLTLQPTAGQPNNLVNEDSRSFELNDLNILSSERSSGFDLIEEGTRITYGLNWSYQGSDLETEVFWGQSVRLSGSGDQFTDGVGLSGVVSDWVGRSSLRYQNWLQIQHRFRLDDSNFDFRRNEAIVTLGPAKNFLELGYFKLDRDLTFINREDREELRARAAFQLSDTWQVNGSVIQDLTNGSDGVEFAAGIGYGDECIFFSFEVIRSFTRDRDIEPGTSFQFRFSLRNLG